MGRAQKKDTTSRTQPESIESLLTQLNEKLERLIALHEVAIHPKPTKTYLELDDDLAKFLYVIHKSQPDATPSKIADALNIDADKVSKTIDRLSPGYIIECTVKSVEGSRIVYEVNSSRCATFRDTAAFLLELLRYQREKGSVRKVHLGKFFKELEQKKILNDFKPDDFLGDKLHHGILHRLEDAGYIERTVNFIRSRERIRLERRYLELLYKKVRLDDVKAYDGFEFEL